MTYVEWPYTVNTKFFKGIAKPEENTTTTEYASGRKISILKNTRFVFDFKCSLGVTNTERTTFWNWFTDTLGGCAGNFHCAALKRIRQNTFVLRQSRMKAKDRKTGF